MLLLDAESKNYSKTPSMHKYRHVIYPKHTENLTQF